MDLVALGKTSAPLIRTSKEALDGKKADSNISFFLKLVVDKITLVAILRESRAVEVTAMSEIKKGGRYTRKAFHDKSERWIVVTECLFWNCPKRGEDSTFEDCVMLQSCLTGQVAGVSQEYFFKYFEPFVEG